MKKIKEKIGALKEFFLGKFKDRRAFWRAAIGGFFLVWILSSIASCAFQDQVREAAANAQNDTPSIVEVFSTWIG